MSIQSQRQIVVYEDKESREIGDYKIITRWQRDTDSDLSWLGQFSSKQKPNAVYMGTRFLYVADDWRNRDCYNYFIPPEPFEDTLEWFRTAPHADYGTKQLSYTKHESYTLARAQLLSNAKILAEYHTGERWDMGCIVKVKKLVKIGSLKKWVEIAESSTWGIGNIMTRADKLYFERSVRSEAFAEAKVVLAEIVK